MADSFTTNLGLTKPEVGASNNTWGSKTNADWDIVDGVFTSTSTTPVAIVLRDDMKFVNATTTSKQVILSCAGISTSTPRTLTAPDASGMLALQSYVDQSMPTGVVVPWAGAATVAPTGWLMCDGSTTVSRTLFSNLFAVVNTTYSAGDGSTTFGVPDLRGMVVAGRPNMSGSDRGNLSGGTTLGAALGSQTSTSVSGPSGIVILESAFNVPVQAANNAHIHTVNVVQPTIVLNYIIKAT